MIIEKWRLVCPVKWDRTRRHLRHFRTGSCCVCRAVTPMFGPTVINCLNSDLTDWVVIRCNNANGGCMIYFFGECRVVFTIHHLDKVF